MRAVVAAQLPAGNYLIYPSAGYSARLSSS